MKLRLPHKFQAALIAALASVSFTTLSTGSAAYAADVQLSDMTQWEGYDEDSGAAFVGSMGATNNAGTVFVGTTDYGTQPQWNNTWSFVVTVDAASLISSANQTLLATIMSNSEDIGYSEGVKATTSGSNATVILTSWSNASQSTTVNVADYNDLTFVLSRDTDNNLKFAVYGDGNFTQALHTAQVNGQIFSTTSMAAVTTGGLDSQYHKHKNGANKAALSADSTVGSFAVTGAAYTWGSKVTEEQLIAYYATAGTTALTWNGKGDDTTWDKSAENWLKGDTGSAFAEGSVAVFAAGEASKTVALGESLTAFALKFKESYTLNLGANNLATTAEWDIASGKTLTLNGTGTASAWTITGGGALANNARLQLGGQGNSTIGSVISGSGSIEKVGAGTLTLTAANTFTGSLTISEGTVKVGNNNALGAYDASRLIEVAAGATLDVNGNEGGGSTGRGDGYTVTLSGGTLTNTGAAMESNKRQYVTHLNLTADSKVVAAQHFGLIGSGYAATSMYLGGHTLTIEGPKTYYVNNATITGGGQLKVASGTLNFNTATSDSQVGSFASNFELAGGTLAGRTLKLASDIYINTTVNSSMSLPVQRQGHGITFKGNANLSVSGNLTGVGSIAKEGSGALTVTGSLDVNSTIRLDGGSLALGGTVTVNSASINAFEVFDATEQTYSYTAKNSGFLTSFGQYYLVKGAENTTATLTGNVSGATVVAEPTKEKGAGDIIITFENPSATTYFVNDDMATGEDATITSTAKDIAIKAGATLTASASSTAFNTAKLHGEGTYALASGAKALNSGLSLGTDWTGTVRISGYSFADDITALNSLGNSNSWVELVGVHGWSNSNTINANLILGENDDDWSYYQDNGNNNQVMTFTGLVKGTGKFGRSNTVGQHQTHVFTNDISGWTGTYEARSANDRSTTLRLQNNAHVVNATLTNMQGVFNVEAQTDVTFNKAVTASQLNISTGKTATLAASATLGSLAGAGALVVDSGSNTVTVNGSNNYTGSITVDGGTLALGNHQFTGVPSLTINDGGTVTTANDNGNGLVGGTVTINAGGTLKATGGKDIFGYEGGATNKVVMQGSADKQAKIDLSGVAAANSVTMTTNLEMKGHSTISGGAINSWDGNITASGTGNTISNFALRKAVTIDVAADGALEIGNLSRFSAAFDGGLTKTGDGTLTLKGGVIDKAITLGAGTLALDGTFTVDDLDLVGDPSVYYIGAEEVAHKTNGVRGGQLDLQLLTAGSTGALSITEAARFSYDGQTMTGSDGEAGVIHLMSEGFSTTFYINEASERTGWIFGDDIDYPATDISIARGATLVVDDNAADGFSASKIHVQDGSGYANLQIQTGNKVLADGTDRALQLSGAGTYKLNGSVGLGSISTAETTASTPWAGTIDATAVDGGTKLLDLLTSTNIHGGTVQLLSKGSSVTPGGTGTETALETNLANQGRTGNFTLADTTFTTGGAMRFNDWQNNHVWTVGSGSALQVGGDLWMDHGNKLAISGGNVTVGGKLLLGHSGGNKPTGLEMTGGSLKATQIDAYSSSASPQIPVSITGGTVEFTGTGNVLQLHNSAVCDVNIGGTGDNFVTLKANGTSWSLAYDGMTIGNIKAETTNNGAITLGTAGKAASYTGKVEVAEGSILTLDGILLLGANGITTSGVLGVSNTAVFNLEHMSAQQEEGKFVYNVFTGGADLSTQGFSAADNIIGVATAGKQWTFGNDGTISYVLLSSELVWKGENGIGVWDTVESNQPWLNGETSSAFRNDDEVTFDSTYSANATATLGGNVEAASITVAAGANVHVAQDAQETYTLTSSSLVVNGSLQSDMPIYDLQFITVGENATWATANTLDITDSTTLQAFSNAGTIKLLSGARMDVDMTAGKTESGTVTAAEGGTLHLHNAPAGTGTFDGHGDFKGTLVYDVVSTGDHSNTLALENFAGTLELRGRLAASACDFGGMTKLVLNGDRGSNTTGLWNEDALTLDVPVEVKGDETVDLYTSNALTLTGDINSAGAKQGHLSKRNSGALNLQGGVYLLSYDNNAGTVNMSGAADITTLNVVAGTVNMSGGANITTLNAENGTVALGGQDKTYTLGAVALGKANAGTNPTLSIGAGAAVTANTVKVEDGCAASIVLADDFSITDSLSTMGAGKTLTITTANGAEGTKTLTTGKLDIANVNTGIALQNAILTVTGKASVAEIITSRTNNNGLMTVGSGATLNLNGGVAWSRDGKYVNLAISNGGTVNIATGESNVLNDITLAAGGDLNLAADTATTVQGTLTLAEALDISGNLTLAGAINIDGFSDEALVAYTRDDQSTGAKDGFKQYSGSLQVININGDAVFTPSASAVTYKTMAGTLGSDGKFTLTETRVYHDTYYVSSADKALSLNDAVTGATLDDPLLAVELLGGATLTADTDTVVPTLRIVAGTAGEAATVSGATANFTNLTGEGALDVDSGATLNAGTITVAQGKALAIGGEGTLGITSINGAGATNVNAASVTGGNVTISGNGTVAFGDSVAPVTFTGLNVTGNSTNVTFAGKVTVTGSHVTVDYTNTQTNVSVTFADGLAYTGSDEYALTIGNGDTVVLGGTSDLSGKTVGIAGETGKLEVLENASVTVGRLYNSSSANNNGTVAVQHGGALTVGTSGNSTITNLSNAGTVTLNGTTTVVSSFTNAGEVTLNGTTTVASAFTNTGSISVVGTSASSMTTLNVNNNGENLDMGAISLNNAELHFGSSGESKVRNISSLTVDGAAKLTQNSWNNLMHIAALNNGTGEGARTFTWQMNTNHYTNSVLYLDGAGSFDGTFVASRGNAGGNNGAYQGHLQINHQQALQNAVLEATGVSSSNYMSVALNADKVETRGLDGNANAIIYAGEANTDVNKGAGRTAPTSTKDATLAINVASGENHTFAGKVESRISLEKSGAGTQTFSGNMQGFNGSIDVQAGELNVMNIAAQTSLNAKDVTIAAGATLGVYNGATATADTEHEGTLTMKSGSHLKAGGDNATLNANLVMDAGSTLEVALAGRGLTMGSSVSLNSGNLLGDADLGFVQDLQFGQYYYLFDRVDSLSINGTTYEHLTAEDYKHVQMDANNVYTQLDSQKYALVYSWNGENVGAIAITVIPEPTTGTLSLLALCALAARRRRK